MQISRRDALLGATAAVAVAGVPALKKFPVAAKQLASAPGLGEKVLRLVTSRAKRGELVSEKDFMSLLVSQARSGLRR